MTAFAVISVRSLITFLWHFGILESFHLLCIAVENVCIYICIYRKKERKRKRKREREKERKRKKEKGR